MFTVGQAVYCKAGRDRGKYMFVLSVKDARWVLLTDGRSHPLERPKSKNVKHIAATRHRCDLFGGERPPTNKQIRRALALLTDL